jgi:transcriptional regulator with GAF, ATPase, and Fis domain
VFLDKIGNLPLTLQAKLLGVLESREVRSVGPERATTVDVRFVAATNEDLQLRAHDGRFRADLYFRQAQYRPARFGLDFSRNLRPDIELHGE